MITTEVYVQRKLESADGTTVQVSLEQRRTLDDGPTLDTVTLTTTKDQADAYPIGQRYTLTLDGA